jgi:LmbE family N-acetylglucosaminyl deacetylase
MALKMLCVLAHPDDESLGLGGVLAKYGSEGVQTYVITATRGELGWFGQPEDNPGPQRLGQIREGELRDAARVLEVKELMLLDYHDGALHEADQQVLTRQIVEQIRRIQPDVIVTFDQNGVYGHPDHIAATRAATAAAIAAADPEYQGSTLPPHAVPKFYYFAWTKEVQEAYERAFGDLIMQIEGVERRAVPWPHWTISTWIDTSAYWDCVWAAIKCHRSQLPGYQKLLDLPDEYHQALWGRLTFHRVYSLVPAPDHEDDLFAGLSGPAA